MNYWLDWSAFIPKISLKYIRSNKTFHKILEIRSNEYPICTPKMAPQLRSIGSQEEYWMVHVKENGKPDMWRVGDKSSD